MVSRPLFAGVVVDSIDPRPEAQAAFEAKFTYLRRVRFPPVAAVGRGRAVDYGASEIFATALLFRLGEASISPSAAANIIIESWPELMSGVAELRHRAEGAAPIVIRLDAAGLRSLKHWDPTCLDLFAGAADHPYLAKSTPNIAVTVNASRLVASIVDALDGHGSKLADRFVDELVSSIEVDSGEGVEFARRDWYFRRATRFFERHQAIFEPQASSQDVAAALASPEFNYLGAARGREISKRTEIVAGCGFWGALSNYVADACARVGVPFNAMATLRALAETRNSGGDLPSTEMLAAHARAREAEINGRTSLSAGAEGQATDGEGASE